MATIVPIVYNIGGSGVVDLSSGRENPREHATAQVVASGLDAVVDIKFQQSNDNVEWHDLPETPLTITSGADTSNLLITKSFYCDFIRVNIDELTATTGTLTITTNYKD